MSKLVVYNDNLTPVALLGKHTLRRPWVVGLQASGRPKLHESTGAAGASDFTMIFLMKPLQMLCLYCPQLSPFKYVGPYLQWPMECQLKNVSFCTTSFLSLTGFAQEWG